MQIVIDIPDRIYYGAKNGITVNGSNASQILIDAVKNSTPTVEVIPIPKDTTNGNIIKSMFPNVVIRVITESQIGISFFNNQNEITWIPIEWWNAPYKLPKKESES